MARLLKHLIQYSLPASLLALLAVTMRVEISQGGEQMASYGFPLAWYSPSIALSMAYTIALAPLFLDLLMYLLICQLVFAFALPHRLRTSKLGFVISVLLWACALVLCLFSFMIIFSDPLFVLWNLDSYFGTEATRNYFFHIGPGISK